MPADPQRIQSIFLSALEAADPTDRAAVLARECGANVELRQRIEMLLQAHDRSGSFLNKPAVQPVTTDEPAGQWIDRDAPLVLAERPGMRVGRYKLLQQIGEGGMGVVYMAEQEQPVRRRVALKIIKPGMDSAQVIARFEAERQALTMMDHQNIAKVLDAGTTESGRPYFVMELVYGVPITKFCDDSQLTPRERLELFVPICQAIQHAHQKGIIHRDIKPSNVLVTMHDDKPVPKVIDFGVAKAIEQRLTEKSLFTAFGTVVGTLEYMSPEQAEMNAFGVDTRGDVYSLGVLLYELLTGTTPLERKRLREAAYTEMLRLIKEVEPPRPSVRLSSSGDLPRIAAARSTEPARLSRLLRGEIDWIVMRCLEKDRTRRYETASALARDVERYLRDEAVEACPPSVAYRLRKFARKYRVMLSTAAAFAALLVIAAGVSIWLATMARQAEVIADEKRQEADDERDRAQRESRRADEAARQAKANAAETGRALDRMSVAKGIDLADKGDLFSALSWFVKPLERGELTKEEEQIHRTRIACYLRHTSGRPVLRQMFFTDAPVSHAAWTADAKRVLTVSGKVVRIWDVSSGESLATLEHPEDVFTAQFAPDGKRLLTASNTAVWQWDSRTGQQLGPPFLDWAAFLQQPLALLPRTPLQLLGNLAAQEQADGKWSDSLSLEISHDGSRVLFGYRRVLRLVDLASQKLIAQWLRGKERSYTDHMLSPDGQRLLLIRDGRASVHDTAANNLAGQAIEHGELVKAAAFSPDSSRALTISRDSTIQLWDTKTWKAQNRMSDPSLGILDEAKFSPDNRFVVSSVSDLFAMSSLSVWEPGSYRQVHFFESQSEDLRRFDWTPDGRQFLRASRHGGVELWDVSRTARPAAILQHGSPVSVAVYGPDARMLLTAGDDGEVRIWDLGRGEIRFALKPPATDAFDTRMQLVSASHRVRQFMNHEVKPDSTFPYERSFARVLPLGTFFTHAAVSPDHTRVLTSDPFRGADGVRLCELQLWDAAAKRPLGKPLQTQSWFNCAAFDPTSTFVVVGSEDGAARILEARTGEPRGSVLQHGGPVLYAAFSPDGKRLVTCGGDHTARLWQTTTGQPIGERLRHDDEVMLAAFAGDGERLATVSLDGTVYLWDNHGGSLGVLTSKSGPLRSLMFHPSGLLLLAYFNLKMRLWDAATEQATSPEMEGNCVIMCGAGFYNLGMAYGEMMNPGFDLPGEDEKARDLIKLAQLYSGQRLDAKGGKFPLHKEERQALWRELRAKHPAEFAASPKAAVKWRIGQLESLNNENRFDLNAFHRRWLAAELAESGWQPSGRPEEDVEGDYNLARLHALALHGRHAAATAAADAIAVDESKNQFMLYNCACVHALAAGAVKGDSALAGRYAARAVALLQQAVAAGYKDGRHMLEHSDLDSLRKLGDFQMLLKKLNAKQP